MTLKQIAHDFFDACETGKGWDVCKSFCTETASFACQAGALEGIETLADYTEWMKGILGPIADGQYTIKGFAVDEDRSTVLAFGVLNGSHTADGGPVPPTGKTLSADYVYAMVFDGDKIHHMTKIWNDGHSLAQLGWA